MDFGSYLGDLVKRHFDKRYGSRDDTRVHVHELLRPAALIASARDGGDSNEGIGYKFIGEAVEIGLREMIDATEAPRAIRIVKFWEDEVADEVMVALRRAGVKIMGDPDDGSLAIEVDGATDIVVDHDPDGARLWEIKTTRAKPGSWKPYMDKWVIQTRLYSSLYAEPVRLVILYINSGDADILTRVFDEDPGFIVCVTRKWLSGDIYPWTGC